MGLRLGSRGRYLHANTPNRCREAGGLSSQWVVSRFFPQGSGGGCVLASPFVPLANPGPFRTVDPQILACKGLDSHGVWVHPFRVMNFSLLICKMGVQGAALPFFAWALLHSANITRPPAHTHGQPDFGDPPDE